MYRLRYKRRGLYELTDLEKLNLIDEKNDGPDRVIMKNFGNSIYFAISNRIYVYNKGEDIKKVIEEGSDPMV